MRCNKVKFPILTEIHCSKFGIADTNGFFEHSCKYGLKIAGRTADDLQHLRSRNLLLERLVSLAGEPLDLRFLANWR